MLRSTFVILSLFVVPVSAYAATCSNGIEPDPTQSRVGRATCSYCSSVTDFARYGAAMLQDNHGSSNARNYNFVVVSNPQGHSVEVDINSLTIGTGIWIGYGIFSSEIRQGNRAQLGVTATPRTGGVSGSPWDNQPTLVSELTKVCSAIQREKEAKEQQNGDPAPRRGSVSEGAYDTDAYWRSGNPHDLYGGRSYERGSQPRTIVRTESCGTERCPSWDAPPELVRSGVDSWYVDWQPPSRETRITTEEIRSGGGRSRSTRTNSTGLGPGAGPDPGKAKEH